MNISDVVSIFIPNNLGITFILRLTKLKKMNTRSVLHYFHCTKLVGVCSILTLKLTSERKRHILHFEMIVKIVPL